MFGFTDVPGGHPSAEWAELETGGCRLALHKASGPGGPIGTPTGHPGNPHKIAFYAEDVEAARSSLVALGAVLGMVHKFGDLAYCDGQDPEGHAFQISNRK
jgi:hypothetical protein